MAQSISITGQNPIDQNKRAKSLNVINNLTTKELENIASLASNEKARAYLSNSAKFAMLKSFL